MSNAAKYKKKAAELELQKQFDKAVAMYARAIEAGDAEGAEVDVTVLNKVGDLTLRLGRVAEAVASYERAVEHYTTVGLFNNAIALCNKILRHAPGRAAIYLTLGRVCARKGMRGDATRNFLEYASRMKQEGRSDEAMRSLAEVAGLMPELEEVRRLVEEHAERAGIALPASKVPEPGLADAATRRDSLVFLEIDYDEPVALTPPRGMPPIASRLTPPAAPPPPPVVPTRTNSLEDLLIFDPLADDAPAGEPAVLDGLETSIMSALDPDPVVPSLPTPAEPVMMEPTPRVADGVTDALGIESGSSPEPDVRSIEGLVTDDAEGTVESLPELEMAPAPVNALPELEMAPAPVDALSELEMAPSPVDALPELEMAPAPVDALSELEMAPAPVDALPELEMAPAPDGFDESADGALGSMPDIWLDEPAGAELSSTPAEFDMLSPFDGVASLTPSAQESVPPVELDMLSPFDSVASLAPSAQESVTPAELDMLSPFDGVESLTPSGQDAVPPAELDMLSPFDGVASCTPPTGDLVPAEAASNPDLVPAEAASTPDLDEAHDEDGAPVAEESLEMADPALSAPSADAPHRVRLIPRLDPHDFILPGELPPIVLSDHWTGLATSTAVEPARRVEEPAMDAAGPATASDVAPLESDGGDGASCVAEAPEEALALTPVEALGTLDDLDELDAALTPRESTAAFNLALDRCHRLRDDVDANPGDWARRRRLGEALLEAGERTAGLDELAATALGLEVEGALPEAVRVLDELIRVAPERVTYHQKRVELAVRLGDRDRLRESYLDLADALVRSGHAVRAEPVYVRVLELDPWDDRARAALGESAPPPPSPKPPTAPADDGYLNLADWLADDAAPRDTRMRVKEPTVTGDEDADFEQLLQDFREGVARSLGDDDYEGHYDLGVAYKEMGLLDDAVAEFQRALRSPSHRLPAYEALGQCFLEQGSFPVAVTVLSRALHEPGLDDEQRVGVLYLLGYACEALQRRDEARSYYQRVYATDIHFRDVAERLTALHGGAR